MLNTLRLAVLIYFSTVGLRVAIAQEQSSISLKDQFEIAVKRILFLSPNQACPKYLSSNSRVYVKSEIKIFSSLEDRVLNVGVEKLLPLLKARNAKIRALALHYLYCHRTPYFLPHIVKLVDDDEKAFFSLIRYAPFRRANLTLFDKNISQDEIILRERLQLQKTQHTVGDFAKGYVSLYLRQASNRYQINKSKRYLGFDDYWEERKERKYCLSWFRAALWPAMSSSPITKEQRYKIKAVRKDIDKISSPYRDWLLFLLGAENKTFHGKYNPHRLESAKNILVNEAELIQALKIIGRTALFNFLEGKLPDFDPDFKHVNPKERSYQFSQLRSFILSHAKHYFSTEDISKILTIREQSRHGYLTEHPHWEIAVAELDPQNAISILRSRLNQLEARSYKHSEFQTYRAQLAAALWRHGGIEQIPIIVDWFFAQVPLQNAYGFGRHGFVYFLYSKKQAPILISILKDRRISQIPLSEIKGIARAVNSSTGETVINESELSQYFAMRSEPPSTYSKEQVKKYLERQKQRVNEALEVRRTWIEHMVVALETASSIG